MKGRVKMFNEEKGYGFILGEDTNDYFVHISDVKSVEPIVRGAYVVFTPTVSEKGNVAKDVILSGRDVSRPLFVDFGDKRIKLSNIKNYGFSYCTVYYGKIYEHVTKFTPGLFGIGMTEAEKWEWKGKTVFLGENPPTWKIFNNSGTHLGNAFYLYYLKNGVIESTADKLSNGPSVCDQNTVVKKQIKYLYITTYQKDNYRFYENEESFDIEEKCKELDGYML